MNHPSTAAPLVDPSALPSVALTDRHGLPREPGIYFVLSGDEELLYIGRSNSIHTRWRGHHKMRRLAEYRAVRVAWLTVSDESLLAEIETALIHHFRPPLNRKSDTAGMPSEKPFLHFNVEPELLERIDNFRFEHRFDSRAAAIKWLLSWSLSQEPNASDKKWGSESFNARG